MKNLTTLFMISVVMLTLLFMAGSTTNAQAIDEKFDGVTAPAFPAGWSYDPTIIDGKWTWNTTVGPYNPTTPGAPSAPNVATFQSYYLASGSTARLITPTLDWTAVTAPTFTFKFRRDIQYLGDPDRVFIDASTDGGTSWTEIAGPYNRPTDIPGTTYWQDISVSVAGYAGQASVKFAFRAVSEYGNWIHIDNVFIGQPPANDVGAVSISTPAAGDIFKVPQTVSANLKNYGTNDQSAGAFNVRVKIWKTSDYPGGTPEFERLEAGPAITAGNTVLFAFTDQWTAASYVAYTILVATELAGDENPTNNAAPTRAVTVVPTIDLAVTSVVFPPTTVLYIGTGYSVRASVKNNGASTVEAANYTVEAWIGPTAGFPGSYTYYEYASYKPSIASGITGSVDFPTFNPSTPGPHTVRIKVTITGDEIPLNDTRDEARTVSSIHYGGGWTGTGGYYFANSTSGASVAPSQPTYYWIDPIAAGHTELTSWASGTGDDGYSAAISIPFSFLYFGNTYTNFYIGSNGIMTFGAGSSSRFKAAIPSTGTPNDLIAGAWTDLDMRTGTYPDAHIYYGGDVTKYVVTFMHAHPYGSTDYVTFQIILKANGNVLIQYNETESTNPPPSAIVNDCAVGIENSDGTLGVQYRYLTAGGPMFASPLAVEFGLDDGDLPIQLASFTGITNPNGSGVLLEWSTISEINNYGFYVERRAESEENFVEIPGSFVQGAGTTLEPQSYSFVDNTLTENGLYHYRLRQVDNDGLIYYSNVVSVNASALSVDETAPVEFRVYQNYPNPFNPSTLIKFSVDKTEHAVVSVYNVLGQEVAVLFNGIAEPGKYYSLKFDGAKFTSGLYFYKVITNSRSEIKKMLLVK